jgi:hypothetical protein
MSLRNGFHRTMDVVAHRILSHRGCHHAMYLVMQSILLCKGFFHVEDAFAQRIFLHTGYRSRCANDWFSGQLQDHFLTNLRGILKIPERFLLRENQIIKTSLIFEKSFIGFDIQRNL